MIRFYTINSTRNVEHTASIQKVNPSTDTRTDKFQSTKFPTMPKLGDASIIDEYVFETENYEDFEESIEFEIDITIFILIIAVFGTIWYARRF